jgi:hypothetical protein
MRLVIAAEGDSANTVTIQLFDLTKALNGDGYLGIKLEAAAKVVLSATATGTNPFEDASFDPASVSGTSTLVQGGGQRLAVYLNRAAKAGDTLTLSLSGAKDKFQLILGDSTVPADGAVITLAAGQTEVMVSLVQLGDVSADERLNLSVAYKGVNEAGAAVTATSNAWGLALKDVGEASKRTCKKKQMTQVSIGLVAVKTHRTPQTPRTTQASCYRTAKSRAMKQIPTCARGIFGHFLETHGKNV